MAALAGGLAVILNILRWIGWCLLLKLIFRGAVLEVATCWLITDEGQSALKKLQVYDSHFTKYDFLALSLLILHMHPHGE